MAGIRERLRRDLTAAMKAKDRATVNVVRQIESEVARARTAPGFTGAVDDDLYRRVITSYVKRMEKARAEFAAAGERGRQQVEQLTFEITYLSGFLPQKLGEEETRALVRRTIGELGVTDPRQTGRVIGAVMRSGSELDGALVARLVAEELNG